MASDSGILAIQYRRGKSSTQQTLIFGGASFIWLSYGMLKLTEDGPISTGTPLNYVLDGFSVILLLIGFYAVYRGWRSRSRETESESNTN